MALQLAWMADELRDAGLDPTEHDGWATRSDPRGHYDDTKYAPIGVIDHHTAGSSILRNYPDPPYWPDTRLEASCNITIRPDGTLSVLNAGIAYDSGLGSRKVYDAVRQDQPLPSPTGLTSDMNGTLYFIDIEVQHRGDGGPIDPRQYETLIRTNAVLLRHYSWNPLTRLIGHREWAPDRKVDPRWNGNTNPMPGIRTDTLQTMEQDMAEPKIPLESWAVDTFKWMIANKIYTEQTDLSKVRETYDFQQMAVMTKRMHDLKPAGNVTIETETVEVVRSISVI